MSETPTGQKPQIFTIQDTSGALITLTGYLVRQVEGVNAPPAGPTICTEDELLASLRQDERDHRRAGRNDSANKVHAAVLEIIRLRSAAGPHYTIHNFAEPDGGDVSHHQV